MGGLIGARYAQRYGDELAGLVLSAPSIGLAPVLAPVLVQLPAGTELPDEPIDPTVLSRDLSVGEAYANDPLVWHGGWKRVTLEAFHKANEAVDSGPGFGDLPVLYIHGEGDQLVPRALAHPAVERLKGDDFMEHDRAGGEARELQRAGQGRHDRPGRRVRGARDRQLARLARCYVLPCGACEPS